MIGTVVLPTTVPSTSNTVTSPVAISNAANEVSVTRVHWAPCPAGPGTEKAAPSVAGWSGASAAIATTPPAGSTNENSAGRGGRVGVTAFVVVAPPSVVDGADDVGGASVVAGGASVPVVIPSPPRRASISMPAPITSTVDAATASSVPRRRPSGSSNRCPADPRSRRSWNAASSRSTSTRRSARRTMPPTISCRSCSSVTANLLHERGRDAVARSRQ